MADPPGKATVIEGGDRFAIAAAGVMQSIGEVKAGAQSRYGLLEAGAILGGEAGMVQELFQHLQDLFDCESVVAPQHPFQLQRDGLGQKQGLAGFDQLAGRLALGNGCGVGFLLSHEVASQDVGVQADQGCSRLAGSKSTGTGGRELLSRPKPPVGRSRPGLGWQGRSSM